MGYLWSDPQAFALLCVGFAGRERADRIRDLGPRLEDYASYRKFHELLPPGSVVLTPEDLEYIRDARGEGCECEKRAQSLLGEK